MRIERIAFLDVETTGTEVETDLLLEVAVIVTTPRLHELDREACVIYHHHEDLRDLDMPDLVRDMHTRNGLLEECSGDYALTADEADERISNTIIRTTPAGTKIHLGGCSVWLDRSMIRKHLPRTYSLLSHRDFNVSSIRDFFMTYHPDLSPARRFRTPHRALADCEAALRLTRRYKLDLTKLLKTRTLVTSSA